MKNIITQLEDSYNQLNEILFNNDLPNSMISVIYNSKEPKNKNFVLQGCFYPTITWTKKGDTLNAICLTSDAINSSKNEILSTLVHEMVHLYCQTFKIEDMTKKKHNADFKKYAEMAKLCVDKDKKVGFGLTYASDELIQIFNNLDIDDSVFDDIYCKILYTEKIKKDPKEKDPKYKHICDCCGREATIKDSNPLICGVCQIKMTIEEKKEK